MFKTYEEVALEYTITKAVFMSVATFIPLLMALSMYYKLNFGPLKNAFPPPSSFPPYYCHLPKFLTVNRRSDPVVSNVTTSAFFNRSLLDAPNFRAVHTNTIPLPLMFSIPSFGGSALQNAATCKLDVFVFIAMVHCLPVSQCLRPLRMSCCFSYITLQIPVLDNVGMLGLLTHTLLYRTSLVKLLLVIG